MAIVLLPTSHIAAQSVQEVETAIEKLKPDCVAVELDMNRYFAMKMPGVSNWTLLKTLGPTTWLVYALFKQIQSWLGKKINVFPGTEMTQAVKLARAKGLPVAFIDQDIRITFLKIKKISRREKLKLVWFILKSVTLGWLMLKLKRGKTLDLRKVPPKKLVSQAIGLIKTEFPGIYRVLIKERDRFMAKRLLKLSKQFKKIVAVVGAGHYAGLKRLLK